jgi:DNA-3-methyladenine glycosylase I
LPSNASLVRCWETTDPFYLAYHDEEWGRPVTTERGIYERLCLEGFQSGLSWLTILRKREAFRAAFEGFDPDAVSRFGEAEVRRLLEDASIVRHRGKIEATIANARATVALRDSGIPLDRLFWAHAAGPSSGAALSKELRRAGFRFVGPTTAYAAMQACGVVNDHLAECWVREAVEAERRSVLPDPLS